MQRPRVRALCPRHAGRPRPLLLLEAEEGRRGQGQGCRAARGGQSCPRPQAHSRPRVRPRPRETVRPRPRPVQVRQLPGAARHGPRGPRSAPAAAAEVPCPCGRAPPTAETATATAEATAAAAAGVLRPAASAAGRGPGERGPALRAAQRAEVPVPDPGARVQLPEQLRGQRLLLLLALLLHQRPGRHLQLRRCLLIPDLPECAWMSDWMR